VGEIDWLDAEWARLGAELDRARDRSVVRDAAVHQCAVLPAHGRDDAGIAALARTASTTGPSERRSSSPVMTSTATTCSGIGRSSSSSCWTLRAIKRRRPDAGWDEVRAASRPGSRRGWPRRRARTRPWVRGCGPCRVCVIGRRGSYFVQQIGKRSRGGCAKTYMNATHPHAAELALAAPVARLDARREIDHAGV
jgi:hypothetical protein